MTTKKSTRGSLHTKTRINGAELSQVGSAEELEFLRAIEEYRQRNQRPFPTWGEVLSILRELGYAKPRPGRKKEKQQPKWQTLCSSLRTERDELQLELAELREENRMLKRSLGHVLAEREPLVIDEEALLKDFDKQPSLATVIAEMKASMAKVEE